MRETSVRTVPDPDLEINKAGGGRGGGGQSSRP